MIPTTEQFDDARGESGYRPIFIVELNGIDRHFATVNPGFSGQRKAGQGIIAGSGSIVGANMPTYEMKLVQLRNDGIGGIQYQLDPNGFARTGQGSFALLNQNYISSVLQSLNLDSCITTVKMGFAGGEYSDYISVFQGTVEASSADFTKFDVSLADDTLRYAFPIPPVVGVDFFPNSFEKGSAFNILLGDVEYVPVFRRVGPVTATLVFDAETGAEQIHFYETNTAFPEVGSITIDSEEVAYTFVGKEEIQGTVFGVFNLATPLAGDHFSGETITLVNSPATYVFGFAGQNVRRIRSGVGAPTAAPIVSVSPLARNGTDDRKVHYVYFTTEQEDITATIASPWRQKNQLVNGNFKNNTYGWTVETGTWARNLPTATFDYVYRGQTAPLQVGPSASYTDATTTPGNYYRLTFLVQNLDATAASVAIGVDDDRDLYYVFNNIKPSNSESLFDVTFRPIESVTRITLYVYNTGNTSVTNTAHFDQFDLYDIATETPSTQIAGLISTHMRDIRVNQASFDVAQAYFSGTGDRCAGLIQHPEESQALLGRICQQFRAKTYLDENGEQVIKVFNQSFPAVYTFTMEDVYKGSLRVDKTPLTDLHTSTYVYYGRRASTGSSSGDLGGRDTFDNVAFATPWESNHSSLVNLASVCQRARQKYRYERTLEIFADFIPDTATAERCLAYNVYRGTHQRDVVAFTAFLPATPVSIGDFIQIFHDLLPTHLNGRKFEIISKELHPNGCTVSFTAEHINPFKFGSYVENWETPLDSWYFTHRDRRRTRRQADHGNGLIWFEDWGESN